MEVKCNCDVIYYIFKHFLVQISFMFFTGCQVKLGNSIGSALSGVSLVKTSQTVVCIKASIGRVEYRSYHDSVSLESISSSHSTIPPGARKSMPLLSKKLLNGILKLSHSQRSFWGRIFIMIRHIYSVYSRFPPTSTSPVASMSYIMLESTSNSRFTS